MSDAHSIFRRATTTARDLLEQVRHDLSAERAFTGIAAEFTTALRDGNKAIICGNGGSMCDAMHFAEELTGRFRDDRPALAAIALADPSHLSCVANDFGYEQVFARGVEALGRPGDVLAVLSTSGRSPNIAAAIRAARQRGMKTVALLGQGGGPVAGSCDHEFIAPGTTSDRIQEVHMMFLHALVEAVEAALFPPRA
ncbi:MAG: SIS domain-containing protein [Phycisphaeraceae bacterium]|nr:SIS domain-containing protein [Phycisphaerae bacterium]MBX3391577.1 SIS domain-containing protein [Phycisphaeraceae bacterium]